VSDPHYYDLPDDELPGMWERADFMGGWTDVQDHFCKKCGHRTDPLFALESGGLCGFCLADYGVMAVIPGPDIVERAS
jgi:hypothetical protein